MAKLIILALSYADDNCNEPGSRYYTKDQADRDSSRCTDDPSLQQQTWPPDLVVYLTELK
jgi:hypothetical protein